MTVLVVTEPVAYDFTYSVKKYFSYIKRSLPPKHGHEPGPPIMMRLAGLDVDECTKFLLIKLPERNNSVYFPMSYIRLPLQLEGTILYIPTRKPMKVELKESEVKYMLLTPNTPKWEPHTTIYRDQEHVILD